MGLKYTRFTSPGNDKKFNEDAVETVEIDGGLLAVLCDGVGGDRGGELAARIALKSAIYFFTSFENDDYLKKIKQAIVESNSFVLNHSLTNQPSKNMATTMELFFLKDNIVYWGHIGDSRIYHYKLKRINQITNDHSLVQKLLDEGFITHKQAANHPQKNVIVKALGDNANVEPDISKIRMDENDGNRFFICSDGVSNLISNSEIEDILSNSDIEEIKVKLVKMIKLRGAYDDYSFIIVDVSK